MTAKYRGRFIVFEGPDKSGKTTQAKLLEEYLKKNGKKVLFTREPGGTDVSEKIRDLLLDPKNKITPLCELLLYEAARAQHVEEKIIPHLKKGYYVICDRFTLSTIAYQGYGRKFSVEMVELLNMIATEGYEPDIVFGFNMPDKEYIKRFSGKKDRMELEKDSFRKKVNSSFRKIFESYDDIIVINATDTIENIHRIIVENVNKIGRIRKKNKSSNKVKVLNKLSSEIRKSNTLRKEILSFVYNFILNKGKY